jgi:integrase
MRVKLNEGEDPGQGLKPQPRRKLNAVEDIWEQFVSRHLEVNAKASSVTRFKRIFKHHILPELKGRRIESIEKRDVLDISDEAGRSGPHAANSVVTVLSSFFNWCLSRDIVKINPMAGVKKPNAETSRERTLSDAEVRTIWVGCSDLNVNPAFASLVRLLILTGCRRSEVAGMEWAELDIPNRLWVIPGARTKNRQSHTVYLTDAMLEIIQGTPRLDGCKYVLTTRENAAISGFAKMRAFLDAATQGLDHWTLHDTRRTIASGLARLGVTLTTIERVLNHQSDSFSPLVRTYQRHDFAAEMQKAWELWSDHVTAVAAGKKSNVVPIKVLSEAV